MTQKKLIIFMPSIEGGGVEKNLFIVANFLSKKIKNISVITASYKYKNKFDKKINLILPKRKLWAELSRRSKYFICLILLFKFLLKNRDTIVFAFQANLYSIIICKLLSVKVIVRSNSAPEGWSQNFIKRILYKKIINQANKIMVNSHDFQKSLKKKYGVNSDVIYNPLNKLEIYKKSKKKINKIFPNNVLKIINVGRFVDQKDQLTILKSLNLLKNKINFHLILLGQGQLKQKLFNYIISNNLSKYVKFIDFKENPYPYIRKADVFILSSKFEGLPNVLLEAAVLKKFIISSNCPTGPREILLNGKLGFLFPVGDFRALTKKILLFYRQPKKNKKLINLAYKNLYRFDYDLNLKKYLKLIKSIT